MKVVVEGMDVVDGDGDGDRDDDGDGERVLMGAYVLLSLVVFLGNGRPSWSKY